MRASNFPKSSYLIKVRWMPKFAWTIEEPTKLGWVQIWFRSIQFFFFTFLFFACVYEGQCKPHMTNCFWKFLHYTGFLNLWNSLSRNRPKFYASACSGPNSRPKLKVVQISDPSIFQLVSFRQLTIQGPSYVPNKHAYEKLIKNTRYLRYHH